MCTPATKNWGEIPTSSLPSHTFFFSRKKVPKPPVRSSARCLAQNFLIWLCVMQSWSRGRPNPSKTWRNVPSSAISSTTTGVSGVAESGTSSPQFKKSGSTQPGKTSLAFASVSVPSVAPRTIVRPAEMHRVIKDMSPILSGTREPRCYCCRAKPELVFAIAEKFRVFSVFSWKLSAMANLNSFFKSAFYSLYNNILNAHLSNFRKKSEIYFMSFKIE